VLGYTGHSEPPKPRAVEIMAEVLSRPIGLVDLPKPDLRSGRLRA